MSSRRLPNELWGYNPSDGIKNIRLLWCDVDNVYLKLENKCHLGITEISSRCEGGGAAYRLVLNVSVWAYSSGRKTLIAFLPWARWSISCDTFSLLTKPCPFDSLLTPAQRLRLIWFSLHRANMHGHMCVFYVSRRRSTDYGSPSLGMTRHSVKSRFYSGKTWPPFWQWLITLSHYAKKWIHTSCSRSKMHCSGISF